MERTLIFPHQLHRDHPALAKTRPVLLVEDSLFFGDPHHPARFHKQKLVFHRATMKTYASELEERGFSVHYKDYQSSQTIENVLEKEAGKSTLHLHFIDPTDFLMEKRLKRFAEKNDVELHPYENKSFLTPKKWNQDYFGSRKQRFMASYYKEQRRRLNILVDSDGKPDGGRWSYDEDNRQPLPENHTPPGDPRATAGEDVQEAIRYVEKNFADNPGSLDKFSFSTSRRGALQWLRGFFETRFHLFGDYEDAISPEHTVLYHSLLTPYLNTGLLTPQEVVEKAIDYAKENQIPLNSLEGFVRQIIGWREFMRAMYEEHGVEMRTENYWNFQRRIPDSFYDGTTGIDPVDHVIRRVRDGAYCHHIERLMILGNFMVLCRIHPDDVYRWFMEMFIDAYDWVMVPNVYGMSQFADGGIFTTKPYISSSNYVRKMSSFKKGPWCEIWDGLFWNFIKQEEDFFRNHPRLGMMTRQLDKMGEAKFKRHQNNAEAFLRKLS